MGSAPLKLGPGTPHKTTTPLPERPTNKLNTRPNQSLFVIAAKVDIFHEIDIDLQNNVEQHWENTFLNTWPSIMFPRAKPCVTLLYGKDTAMGVTTRLSQSTERTKLDSKTHLVNTNRAPILEPKLPAAEKWANLNSHRLK